MISGSGLLFRSTGGEEFRSPERSSPGRDVFFCCEGVSYFCRVVYCFCGRCPVSFFGAVSFFGGAPARATPFGAARNNLETSHGAARMRDPAERCGAARCASRSGPLRIALEENSSCRPDFCAPDPQGIGAGFISSSGPPGVSSVRPEENSGVRNGVLSRSTGGGLRSLRTPDPRGSGAEFSSGRPRGSSPPVGRRRIPPSSLPPSLGANLARLVSYRELHQQPQWGRSH